MKTRIRLLPVFVLAGSVSVASCGDHGADHSSSDIPGSAGAAATIAADADFNDADVIFAQEMIPHHEQAIEMADIALDPQIGAGADVQQLATDIKGAQDPEIMLMKGWLEAWGQPEMDDLPDHDMSSMDGVMSAEDMDRLGTLTGATFDAAWLQMMIAHHEGAVTMAQDVKDDGENADVTMLADQVIALQTAEIEAMNALLAG